MGYTNPKLSKHVGIIMDLHFPKKAWAGNLVMQMPPNGVVVTATGGAENYIEKAVSRRDDLNFLLFEVDPWERGKKGQNARDWMLITYLEFYKGKLFLFPNSYDRVYGTSFSDRIQDLLILAHQRGVKYEIVAGEE